MSSRERIAILGLYRQLLQHAKVYPKEKYELLLHEARAGFGNKKHITERKRIQEAIKAGESRLSFLKMTLPVAYIRELKRKAERQQHMVRGPETAAEFIEENKNDYVVVENNNQNYSRFVYDKDGNQMDQNMHRTSRMYSFRQIEEEDLKRHYNMIDRMHFSGDQWSGKQMGHSNSWMEDATIACEDPNMPIVFDQE